VYSGREILEIQLDFYSFTRFGQYGGANTFPLSVFQFHREGLLLDASVSQPGSCKGRRDQQYPDLSFHCSTPVDGVD
jgi:hypothetical protein